MQAIDTNVLVRYMVRDDAEIMQVNKADKIMSNFTEDNPVLINPVILCEFIWVCIDCYAYYKPDILDALKKILSTVSLRFIEHEILWKAYYDYSKGSADFSDYYIGLLNKKNGATETITFDKKAGQAIYFIYK